jgi:hypothetical protein
MKNSEDRIEQIMKDMLKNADEEGWCHIPEGLTEEEQATISKRISIITMRDRVEILIEGIEHVFEYLKGITKDFEEYNTMDMINI